MYAKRFILAGLVIALAVIGTANLVVAQGPAPRGARAPKSDAGTAFTYQGQLKNNSVAVNQTCNFQFSLYDAASGGNQIGSTQTETSVNVSNGLFTTSIDFGVNAMTGDARYLAIAIACPSGSSYTPMTGRQMLTPAPMALALPGLYTQQTGLTPNLIGGYSGNSVNGVYGATIAGGGSSAYPNVIAGTGTFAFLGGGVKNTANGNADTIAGGFQNTTNADDSTVGGGVQNAANGAASTVPGGYSNSANGKYSFAAGHQAVANHDGSFVWSDSSSAAFVTTTGPNQFVVQATGGLRLPGAGINTSTSMFKHRVTSGNICPGLNYQTVIDNPLTNGDAGAILVVTPNYGLDGSPYAIGGPAKDIPAVYYDSTNQCGQGAKWVIYNLNSTAMVNNSVYNVFVIKP